MLLTKNEMADDIHAIKTLRNETNIAIAARDLTPVLHIWKENVHITRGNGSFITGRQAMAAVFKQEFTDALFIPYYRTAKKIIISNDGSMAAEQGSWKATRLQNNIPVQTTGIYQAMWQKENGCWQVHAELYIALAVRITE